MHITRGHRIFRRGVRARVGIALVACTVGNAALGFDTGDADFFERRGAASPGSRMSIAELLRARSPQFERPQAWIITDPALHDAMRNADREQARGRIARTGGNVNGRDELGDSALLIAVRQADTETARALIRAGAAVDVKGADGFTALGRAALDGELALARSLLDAGARVDLKSDNGSTALLNAVALDRRAVARLLWRRGADPWAFDRDGLPALVLAIERGHTRLALDLLELGADPNTLDRQGKPVMYWAVLRRNRDAALALLRRGAVPGAMSLDVFSPPIEPAEYADPIDARARPAPGYR